MMGFNTYQYVCALAFLYGGSRTFSNSLGPMDANVPTLIKWKMFGLIASIACFIGGFFYFAWWAPFVGNALGIVLWKIIESKCRGYSGDSVIIHLRCHIAMVIGLISCADAMFAK